MTFCLVIERRKKWGKISLPNRLNFFSSHGTDLFQSYSFKSHFWRISYLLLFCLRISLGSSRNECARQRCFGVTLILAKNKVNTFSTPSRMRNSHYWKISANVHFSLLWDGWFYQATLKFVLIMFKKISNQFFSTKVKHFFSICGKMCKQRI